jgi:chaperone required for assembly of F1-ATPase
MPMREILTELEVESYVSDPDPVKRAQNQMRTPLPKRFYKEAIVVGADGSYAVHLDGRPVKTPARTLLSFPTAAAAQLVADEFAAQDKEINPAFMPATRLANTAIDGVATEVEAVQEDIIRFASNDLICYRAEGPDALVARQAEIWDRYIDWTRSRYGARLYLTEGVIHVAQPREAIALIGAAVKQISDPLRLACVHTMTTLTGSAILALAVHDGEVDAQEAWKAAHLDEDWTIEQWGEDREATDRRAARWQDMKAADDMLKALS